jgi:hypothetical protein
VTITQVFQMTTDLQRTTRYGDLNCQKAMGMITGVYGFWSTMSAMRRFLEACAWNMQGDATLALAGGGSVAVEIDFRAGVGFYLLLVATALKVTR